MTVNQSEPSTGADPSLRERGRQLLADLIAAAARASGRTDQEPTAPAEFREDQWAAIEALVVERRRVLVVQRTGWGKSAVYFVATGLLRAEGAGPTLIVSPLLALMRNQVEAAAGAGVRAATLNSSNVEEWDAVRARLAAGEVDVLLVSPERLNNPDFRDRVLPGLVETVGMVVVDEAHCVSDWGHDFRPDYRRIRDLVTALPPTVPVLATTATANSRVVTDIETQLAGQDAEILTLRGSLDRQSLRLGVLRLPNDATRLGWLSGQLADLPGSGIVYCLTVAQAEDVATALREAGHNVLAYTGRTAPEEREAAEQALLANRVKALVATSALGMGFDKPDLGFVLHLGAPASPISYYQQVGRAGRAVEHADALLLPGEADEQIWRYFRSVSMPDERTVRTLLDVLTAHGPLSTPALESRIDLGRSRLEMVLKVLDVDGAVRRETGGWRATGQDWVYDTERYARLAKARNAEEQAMRDYLRRADDERATCRMLHLRTELDDPGAEPCGRCDVCAGPWYPTDVPEAALAKAWTELHRPGVEVAPRTMWPTAMASHGIPLSGRIGAGDQVAAGRVIARMSDLGWGMRLREQFRATEDHPIGDDLVKAVVEVLKGWEWDQRPAAVVAMPSRTRPILVGSLARRIAEIGRLPLAGALRYAGGGPAGTSGGSSSFRLAAVHGRFEVPPEVASALPAGAPVLLVDDYVDSRWTLTVAGRALRQAGAAAVLPFALALSQ